MRPIAGVWRKGNRRASRGEPRPRQQVYWPVCGSPSVEYLESRETATGGVEFVWVCRTCDHTWTESHWVPLARMRERRHHVPERSSRNH